MLLVITEYQHKFAGSKGRARVFWCYTTHLFMTPFFAFRVSRVQITTLYVKITCLALVIDFYTAFYSVSDVVCIISWTLQITLHHGGNLDAKFKQNSHKSIIAKVQLKGNLVVQHSLPVVRGYTTISYCVFNNISQQHIHITHNFALSSVLCLVKFSSVDKKATCLPR